MGASSVGTAAGRSDAAAAIAVLRIGTGVPMGARSNSDGAAAWLAVCAAGTGGFKIGVRRDCATPVASTRETSVVSAASMICCSAVLSAAGVRIAAGSRGALVWTNGSCCRATVSAGIGPPVFATASASALALPEVDESCVRHCTAPNTAVATTRDAKPASNHRTFDQRLLLACQGATGASGGSVNSFGPRAGIVSPAARTATKSEL